MGLFLYVGACLGGGVIDDGSTSINICKAIYNYYFIYIYIYYKYKMKRCFFQPKKNKF